MTYNCWAQMPQYLNGKRPWSLIARNVTAEQAETYRATFLFPLHIEDAATETPGVPE